jgi:hypothetical protein
VGARVKKGGGDECKIERQKNEKVREREEEQRRRVFYVGGHWRLRDGVLGAKLKKAKLTGYNNSQVPLLLMKYISAYLLCSNKLACFLSLLQQEQIYTKENMSVKSDGV